MARVIQYRLGDSAPMPAVTTPALMMQGDNLADSIQVQLEGANLAGYTATYYLEREDGVRVPVDGTIDGDTVTVTLTEPCYRVPGSYNGLMRISNAETGERRTILRMSGRILSEGAGPILDEESVIPSVEDIIAQLEVMEKAVEATEAAIENAETAAENADNAAGYAVNTTDKAIADLQAQVNSGAFDGRGFVILGYYATLDALISAVPAPERGDAYGVGSAAPYDIYVWDAVNGLWINNGSLGAVESYEVISMTQSTFDALTTAEKVELYAQGVRMVSVDTDGEVVLHVLSASGGSKPAASGDPIDDTQTTTENTWSSAKISEELRALLLMAHPVGSLYWSSDPTNPADIFGGEWEQITDTFVLAAGKRENGATGGAESVTLTVDQLPEHSHSVRVILPSGESGAEGTGWAIDKWASGSYAYKSATGSTGGSTPVDTMPPYLVRYCWERTA